ncbi:MAG: FAD-dependent monooxygenase [Acidimicrobiales bacterium]|nr:FAD-dependent monooxygenase [Acidimicrobiales bacterium]
MRIGIVGGGIGGLTAALALRERHEVTLFEAAPAFAPVGAGIVLAPNAVACLARVGVDVGALGVELPAIELRRSDDVLLTASPAAAHRHTLGPTLGCARADVHAALVAALGAGAPVDLRLGAAVTAVDPAAPEVSVAGSAPEDFDLVVGADGLHSSCRLAHGGGDVRYSGDTCWRGFAPNPGLESAVEWWGPRSRIGLVQVPGDRVYYFLVQAAPEGRSGDVDLDDLRHRFAGFPAPAAAVIDGLDEPPPLHHDLCELDEPLWGTARLPLLGDASHAMTPNLGQGAAMAIEDAVVLGRVLGGDTGATDLDAGFAAYVEARHDRVRRIQLDARRLGGLSRIRGPLSRRARDLALRLTPDRITRQRFDEVALGGPARTGRAGGTPGTGEAD